MTHDPIADKVSSLIASCDELRAFVLTAVRDGLTFHDYEQGLRQRLHQAGRAATQEFLDAQGPGDLGPTLQGPTETLRRLPELHARPLTCTFGTFTLQRTCYGTREGQTIDFVPLDARLQLPAGKFSYLLQDFNALLTTEEPFAGVAATLKRILLLEQHVDSLERQGQHMAEYVEPYRDALPSPGVAEGPILVQSADAKGVAMRCAADAPPIESHDHKRGPKTGRKKQAILGAVYSVEPLVRTPEQIVERLFRDPKAPKPEQPKRPEPCNKRVMARLNEYTDEQGTKHDGMAEVFAWMQQQLEERDWAETRVIVNLLDGDERLWDSMHERAREGDVDVLDLLHVTPRLWKVAGLFAKRDSAKAQQQVRTWVLAVLRGQVAAVLARMRQQGEQAGLKGTKKKALELACGYLEKRQEQMRYHEYLKKGYPIASGVIEGACRHYVKDRMERTGMSWKQKGAQAMLELRAQALNGDWDEFQEFYRLREGAALYPHRYLLEEVAWPLAA